MSCLSKDAQAARGETNDDLEHRQGHGRNNGAETPLDFFSWRLSSEKGWGDIDDPVIRKEFKTKV